MSASKQDSIFALRQDPIEKVRKVLSDAAEAGDEMYEIPLPGQDHLPPEKRIYRYVPSSSVDKSTVANAALELGISEAEAENTLNELCQNGYMIRIVREGLPDSFMPSPHCEDALAMLDKERSKKTRKKASTKQKKRKAERAARRQGRSK